jgi:hypothetical protein
MLTAIQFIQSLAVIALTIVGARIAWQQKQIAAEKLKLEKFDRRFKVFEATRSFLVHILNSGGVDFKNEEQFWVGTMDAVFLFDTEIVNFLEDVRLRAIKFQEINREYARYPERRMEEFNRFRKDLESLPERFSKYLNLAVH